MWKFILTYFNFICYWSAKYDEDNNYLRKIKDWLDRIKEWQSGEEGNRAFPTDHIEGDAKKGLLGGYLNGRGHFIYSDPFKQDLIGRGLIEPDEEMEYA